MFPTYFRIIRTLLVAGVVFGLAFSPNGAVPSGAAEITLNVDTTIDSIDPAYQVCSASPGDCSLRGAISVANANPANHYYTVNIPAGTYPIALPGAFEDNNQTGDWDILGRGALVGVAGDVLLQGSQLDRVLQVHPGAEALLVNLRISGGRSPNAVTGMPAQPGGGVYNQGLLTIKNSVIESNQAGNGISGGPGGSGGGIQNDGYLTLEGSLVRGNTAGTGGPGRVCSSNPDETFCWDCSPGGTGGEGGGINNLGTLEVSGSIVDENFAGEAGSPGMCISWWTPIYAYGQPGFGGGIANQQKVAITDSTLQRNQGKLRGGGLSNQGYAYLINATLSDNGASDGGGINNQKFLEIEHSLVSHNTSSNNGGGIYSNDELHLLGCTINENNAALGGGVYNVGQAFIVDGAVDNNSTFPGRPGEDETGCIKMPCPATDGGSPHGGGVYNIGWMQFDGVLVSGNATGNGGQGGAGQTFGGGRGGDGGFGGGIFNTGSLALNFTTVMSNTTGDGGAGGEPDGKNGLGGSGGGVYNSGTMMATHSQVRGNQTGIGIAQAGRGGGLANNGRMAFNDGIITANHTGPAGDGGGIYSSQPLTLTASTMIDNAAGGRGGAIFISGGRLWGVNDIFASNQVGPNAAGSALYLQTTTAHLLHTSLVQNTGGDGSGVTLVDASLWMTNTILVSHTVGISVPLGARATFAYTLWGVGTWANQHDWAGGGAILTGMHNLWFEPGFVAPLNFDFHLGAASAAIDQGMVSTVDIDVDNQPRPNPATGVADLGADEYWALAPLSEIQIIGPTTGVPGASYVFTATLVPDAVTPNILFYWLPPPASGQWTNTARYRWLTPGVKSIEVSALQAGSTLTESFTISLDAAIRRVFLPMIFR